jgi:hypothetical protein
MFVNVATVSNTSKEKKKQRLVTVVLLHMLSLVELRNY